MNRATSSVTDTFGVHASLRGGESSLNRVKKARQPELTYDRITQLSECLSVRVVVLIKVSEHVMATEVVVRNVDWWRWLNESRTPIHYFPSFRCFINPFHRISLDLNSTHQQVCARGRTKVVRGNSLFALFGVNTSKLLKLDHNKSPYHPNSILFFFFILCA